MSWPVHNYCPPLDWLDRHSAEGGISCAEIKLRELEEGSRQSRANRCMTLQEAAAIIARWDKEDAEKEAAKKAKGAVNGRSN